MDVMVRSYATPSGFRLVYDDTGVFDVSEGGREIRWHRTPIRRRRGGAARRARSRARARAARVGLAVAARQRGRPRRRRGGVPRAEGERKVHARLRPHARRRRADDRRHRGDRAAAARRSCGPGVQSVRLFRDSADWLSAPAPIAGTSDIKATFGQLAADARRLTRAPLAALYLLESVPAGTIAEPVVRERIEGPAAVFQLLTQTKIGTLLGGGEAPTVFDSVVGDRRGISGVSSSRHARLRAAGPGRGANRWVARRRRRACAAPRAHHRPEAPSREMHDYSCDARHRRNARDVQNGQRCRSCVLSSIGIPASCIKPDNRSGRASFPFRETRERIA